VSQEARREALEAGGLVHPRPETVTASLFVGADPFFFALDKLQVKYEMLRAHVVDGSSVSAAAAAHGYSRAAFYLIAAAFEERGMAGLVDERPGRRGPVKLNEEIVGFLRAADPDLSGAALAARVEERFGVSLHRRTVERARRP
jgi:Transposase and inactivated derivatives